MVSDPQKRASFQHTVIKPRAQFGVCEICEKKTANLGSKIVYTVDKVGET